MKLHIYQAINQFASSKPMRLGMPGHKGRLPLFKNYAKLDVTEYTALDVDVAVKKAEGDIAKILKTKYAKILTNGSTLGILAMIYAVKGRGKEIIINRTAHKSVYNALKLCGINPIIADFGFDNGLPVNPTVSETEKLLDMHPKAIGVLYTYPDYYGRVFEIKKISEILKAKNKLLLIDGAHGGHYAYTSDRAYAGEYADVWVDGVHKNLPALNQGALLLSSNEGLIPKLEEGLNLFATTSPSYPIMASVEYAVKYMNTHAKSQIERVEDVLAELKIKVARAGVTFVETTDSLKLTLDFGGAGIDASWAEQQLINKKIHCELNDGRYLLFMFSVFTKSGEIKKLCRALLSIIKRANKTDVCMDKPHVEPQRKLKYLVAIEDSGEYVDLDNAIGKIAGDNAGLFPPCYPLVTAGEVIDERTAKLLKATNVFGVKDGKIKIVKDN